MSDVAGQFLAEYLRLSVEDGDVVSNDAKADQALADSLAKINKVKVMQE